MATETSALSACEKIDKEEPDKVPLPKESEATPKTEELAAPPASETEVIVTPVVTEVKEVNIPDEKPKVEASDEVAKETVIEPKGVSLPEPVAESVECKSDEKAELAKEEKPAEEPANGVGEPKPPSVETSEEKAEKLEEKEVGKEIPVVEDSKLPAEEKTAIEETVAPVSLDQDKSGAPEVAVQEKDVECYPSGEVLDKIGDKKEEEKEPAKETVEKGLETGKVEEADIPEVKTEGGSVVAEEPVKSKEIEVSSDDKAVEPGKFEAETEIPKAVTEEKCVPKSEENPNEGAITSVPPEIVEKGVEEAVISKDIEPVAENEKKGADSEGKPEKEVPEKTETDEKKEEACETNVEKEKQVDEAVKPDVEDAKPTEDCKEPETTQEEAPKEEVPVKTHKQSNNILKKMKNSLIKAKKAIVGKSQTSKSSAAATEPTKE